MRLQHTGKWQTLLVAASEAALLTKDSSDMVPRKTSSLVVRCSRCKSILEEAVLGVEAWSSTDSRIIWNMWVDDMRFVDGSKMCVLCGELIFRPRWLL